MSRENSPEEQIDDTFDPEEMIAEPIRSAAVQRAGLHLYRERIQTISVTLALTFIISGVLIIVCTLLFAEDTGYSILVGAMLVCTGTLVQTITFAARMILLTLDANR